MLRRRSQAADGAQRAGQQQASATPTQLQSPVTCRKGEVMWCGLVI